MNPEQTTQMLVSLAEIREGQKHIIGRMEDHLRMDENVHGDLETRARSLEKSRSRQQGVTAVVAALVSSGVALLIRFKGGA